MSSHRMREQNNNDTKTIFAWATGAEGNHGLKISLWKAAMNEPHRAEEFHGEKFKIWATKGWREPKKHTWKGFSPSATECCYGLIVSIQMESTQSICGQPQTVSCQAPWRLYRYRYKKSILEHFFLSFFSSIVCILVGSRSTRKKLLCKLGVVKSHKWEILALWSCMEMKIWKKHMFICLRFWA